MRVKSIPAIAVMAYDAIFDFRKEEVFLYLLCGYSVKKNYRQRRNNGRPVVVQKPSIRKPAIAGLSYQGLLAVSKFSVILKLSPGQVAELGQASIECCIKPDRTRNRACP